MVCHIILEAHVKFHGQEPAVKVTRALNYKSYRVFNPAKIRQLITQLLDDRAILSYIITSFILGAV